MHRKPLRPTDAWMTHGAEDVVVIGHCGYELQHQAAAPSHVIPAGAVLNMLPGCPRVLLMHADRLLDNDWLPCMS